MNLLWITQRKFSGQNIKMSLKCEMQLENLKIILKMI